MGVGHLVSAFSAFSKSSLHIWKFTVHILLKPGLENFEHYFTSVWDECNCVVVWVFFGAAFLWGIKRLNYKVLSRGNCRCHLCVCSLLPVLRVCCEPLNIPPPRKWVPTTRLAQRWRCAAWLLVPHSPETAHNVWLKHIGLSQRLC